MRGQVQLKSRRTKIEIQISIIAVDVQTKPTAKGSYQMAEVTYKDIQKGQVGNKKIMSFTDKNIFDTAANAKAGELYDVTLVKGEKFWEWTALNRSGTAQPQVAGAKTATASPRSTYETPEERARRQVLIVRQSSLSSAIASLTPGAKSQIDPGTVLGIAKTFEDYVFGEDETDIQDNAEDGFDDVPH